jgi:hypothetical protein
MDVDVIVSGLALILSVVTWLQANKKADTARTVAEQKADQEALHQLEKKVVAQQKDLDWILRIFEEHKDDERG